MSRTQHPAAATDFSQVFEYLKTRGVVPETPPGSMLSKAKRLHEATYSLILWKFRLKKLPDHGRVFVEEIASDALQILPQSLFGFGKTTNLLVRGIIENTVRHVYFTDHPIEFERMNREHKWYPGLDELFDYPGIHPVLMHAEKKHDATNKLRTLYNDLSASVHGRRVEDLEMRTALEKITYSDEAFETQVQSSLRCAAATNFILAAFHAEQFAHFIPSDRQLVLKTIPPQARRVLTGIN